ncbi:hypothetical protein [Roseibium sp. MMSF_3544]|uniref:capsular polysaccharide export protein, LipB/KpsS family n=1 Tax=unclassified Roseibium TaxID=2629323 RepID=UPI00273FFC8C|nr:hypothetical protein [Roseibium sp. MMSF_3544]
MAQRLLKSNNSTRFLYFPLDVKDRKITQAIQGNSNVKAVVWGGLGRRALVELLEENDVETWRMEDAFIRSTGLGADFILPNSLMLDKTGGIYFDATKPSSVENYLNHHSFKDEEIHLAKTLIEKIRNNSITKYNLRGNAFEDEDPSDKGSNILVFGQCEDDASIKLGSPRIKFNTDLIQLALAENPGSRVYYRPHPDVARGLRKSYSDPRSVTGKISFLDIDTSIWDNISRFDKVYVMTSLAGFEAILRGKQVRVAGLPFYAGWGISDDLLQCPRRRRKLSKEEVFYGAYVATPLYFDPKSGQELSLDIVLDKLIDQKSDPSSYKKPVRRPIYQN